MKKAFIAFIAIVAMLSLAACGSKDSAEDQAREAVVNHAEDRSPYIPKNDVEFQNYNKAQELYDDPSTIIWCTAFPSSPAAPFVTVPVAGKLTSSTTSYFGPETIHNGSGDTELALPARSIDGLYHPNPPPYRYGFTPGGQYVDFFNLQTICTTQPLKFQRQNLAITPDSALANADTRAQNALKAGNPADAQRILERAANGQ